MTYWTGTPAACRCDIEQYKNVTSGSARPPAAGGSARRTRTWQRANMAERIGKVRVYRGREACALGGRRGGRKGGGVGGRGGVGGGQGGLDGGRGEEGGGLEGESWEDWEETVGRRCSEGRVEGLRVDGACPLPSDNSATRHSCAPHSAALVDARVSPWHNFPCERRTIHGRAVIGRHRVCRVGQRPGLRTATRTTLADVAWCRTHAHARWHAHAHSHAHGFIQPTAWKKNVQTFYKRFTNVWQTFDKRFTNVLQTFYKHVTNVTKADEQSIRRKTQRDRKPAYFISLCRSGIDTFDINKRSFEAQTQYHP